jgi:hypothetical protein
LASCMPPGAVPKNCIGRHQKDLIAACHGARFFAALRMTICARAATR